MEDKLKVLAYTLSPWEHAIVNYRLVGPCFHAGMELIRGNLYKNVRFDFIGEADLVVIQRDFPRLVEQFCTVVDQARALRKPVILDLDDNLFELPPEHPDRLIHYYTEALYPTLAAVLCVDAVTASTRRLYEYLARINSNTYLLPNYLDPEIWKVSFPQYQSGDSDPLIIGYMGGDSHYPDLEMIAPVLEGILNSYGQRICFQFWGVEPPLDHQKWENVAWTRLQDPDYRSFSAYFIEQTCDIFIAPLKNNLFNQSKSPVKYFEYSILGIPGVYSWLKPYEEVISHGRNGFLAETMSDWESCLISLIEDETLRTQMGNAARSDVRQNWLISDHADLWINTYKKIIADGKGSKKRLFPTDVIRSIGNQNKSWQNELLNP